MIGKRGSRAVFIDRKHEREVVDGYVCEIADGNMVMSGNVDDVSLEGVKISKLPVGFTAARKPYVAILSGNNKYFKILLRPCWSKKEEEGVHFMDVGFKIIDAPWEWNEFISEKSSATAH